MTEQHPGIVLRIGSVLKGAVTYLRFTRTFDDQFFDVDFPLEKASTLKRLFPVLLDDFKEEVRWEGAHLTSHQAHQALEKLELVAEAILTAIAADQQYDLLDFLRPVFLGHATVISRAPVVVVDGPRRGLAKSLPVEFLPVMEARSTSRRQEEDRYARGLALSRFLGFRAAVTRGALEDDQLPVLDSGHATLRTKIFGNSDLPSARREINFFRSRSGRFDVGELWPPSELPANVGDSFATAIMTFIPGEHGGIRAHIIHFACHYEPGMPPSRIRGRVVGPRAAQLRFRSAGGGPDVIIPVHDIPGYLSRARGRKKPERSTLVFLNACRSGGQDEFTIFTLPEVFSAYGWPNVVGGETDLPDFLASEFSKSFYSALLEGATLGTATYRARWELFERLDNPGGILFTMYGNAFVRLQAS